MAGNYPDGVTQEDIDREAQDEDEEFDPHINDDVEEPEPYHHFAMRDDDDIPF